MTLSFSFGLKFIDFVTTAINFLEIGKVTIPCNKST